MEAVKDLLVRRNVDVAVIPGGLTPVLQPLDKCINKPFKNKVQSKYQAWMVNSPFTYTLLGKKRAPSKELVLQWIHKAWQEIPADLVHDSFKSCGISNALDSTNDEAVWKEGAGADEADDELENKFDTDSEQEDEATRQPTQQPPHQLLSEPPRFFSEPPHLKYSMTDN